MSYKDQEKKKAADKAWVEANPDKRRATYKKYRLMHLDKCRAATKKWRESHLYEISVYGKLYRTPECRAKVKAYQQLPEVKARVKARSLTPEFKARRVNYGLKYRHGLSPAERAILLEGQGGKCVCGKRDIEGHRLHVDHDHQFGHARGLLCGNCNRALGLLKDNVFTLKGLLAYVRRANTWTEKAHV